MDSPNHSAVPLHPLTFAFAVPCFNEAQNLPALLSNLDRTRVDGHATSRFVIVSDDSRDGTNEAVMDFARTTSTPVKLICNERRRGKPAAINQCLAELRNVDIIVLISGDILPRDECIAALVGQFKDPSVGVAAGRPVPFGITGNLAFEVTRLMWDLHHVIALRFPKSTEITTFRNVVEAIDDTSFVDEAEIEVSLLQKGFSVRYVPEALIVSPSPLRLTDYLKQRAVVTLGYLRLRRKRGYSMKTQKLGERVRAIAVVWRMQPVRVSILLLAIVLEVVVRGWAWIQFLAGTRKNGIWGRSESTKRSCALALEES